MRILHHINTRILEYCIIIVVFVLPPIFSHAGPDFSGEKNIPPFVHADYACFSCRVKLIKPEPAIYEDCLRGLGVKAGEAVFFDDIRHNIDAALKLGMNAFVWTGLEQGKKDWEHCIAENA